MSHQREIFEFLIHKLIYSDRKEMYEVVQFFSDMVMQEEEEIANSRRLYCLYFDAEDRRALHEKMCRWFDANMLDVIFHIQKGLKSEEDEKEAIKSAFLFRARYLVSDIASGRVQSESRLVTRLRNEERRERKEGNELAQEQGEGEEKGKEKEPIRSSPADARARSGIRVSSASQEKQDLAFADHNGPERQVLLKELFRRAGKPSLSELVASLSEEEDLDISPSDLRAYLNSLEDADAGTLSISVRSPHSLFNPN